MERVRDGRNNGCLKLIGHVLTRENQHRSEALTQEFAKVWDKLPLYPAHMYIAHGTTEHSEKNTHTFQSFGVNPMPLVARSRRCLKGWLSPTQP